MYITTNIPYENIKLIKTLTTLLGYSYSPIHFTDLSKILVYPESGNLTNDNDFYILRKKSKYWSGDDSLTVTHIDNMCRHCKHNNHKYWPVCKGHQYSNINSSITINTGQTAGGTGITSIWTMLVSTVYRHPIHWPLLHHKLVYNGQEHIYINL